jgi:hypothetical protein
LILREYCREHPKFYFLQACPKINSNSLHEGGKIGKFYFLRHIIGNLWSLSQCGARDGVVVEALGYKPEGRGSIPDDVTGFFH